MTDYYNKLINDHSLITYIEDAFAQFDFKAHQSFQSKMTEDHPNVVICFKKLFSEGGFKRIKLVVEGPPPKIIDGEENQNEKL